MCIKKIIPEVICTENMYTSLTLEKKPSSADNLCESMLVMLESTEKDIKQVLIEYQKTDETKELPFFRTGDIFTDELQGLIKALQLSRLKLRQHLKLSVDPLFPYFKDSDDVEDVSDKDIQEKEPYFIGPLLPKQNWTFVTTPSLVLRK